MQQVENETNDHWMVTQYIVNNYQVQKFSLTIKYAKIAITVPVTNVWPERRASAVKRIQSWLSTMKKDVLNAFLMISMNGPTNNSKEATLIIQKATERYQSSKQHQVPGLKSSKKN